MLAATVSGASVSVVVVVVVVLPAVAPFLYVFVCVCGGVWVLFSEFVRFFQSLGGVVLARELVLYLSLSSSFYFSLSHPYRRTGWCLNRDVGVYIMLSNTDGRVFLRPEHRRWYPGYLFDVRLKMISVFFFFVGIPSSVGGVIARLAPGRCAQ